VNWEDPLLRGDGPGGPSHRAVRPLLISTVRNGAGELGGFAFEGGRAGRPVPRLSWFVPGGLDTLAFTTRRKSKLRSWLVRRSTAFQQFQHRLNVLVHLFDSIIQLRQAITHRLDLSFQFRHIPMQLVQALQLLDALL
jgi:hypothetical protein